MEMFRDPMLEDLVDLVSWTRQFSQLCPPLLVSIQGLLLIIFKMIRALGMWRAPGHLVAALPLVVQNLGTHDEKLPTTAFI